MKRLIKRMMRWYVNPKRGSKQEAYIEVFELRIFLPFGTLAYFVCWPLVVLRYGVEAGLPLTLGFMALGFATCVIPNLAFVAFDR